MGKQVQFTDSDQELIEAINGKICPKGIALASVGISLML